jgi:hypothetical protein
MFLLARKGFADRIKLRSVFGGDSVLLKHGLLRHLRPSRRYKSKP